MSGKKPYISDVTLCDGIYAIRHQYSLKSVRQVAKALDDVHVGSIEVAHGGGLQGSSFNYGFGTHSDPEWIEAAADVVKHAKTVMLLLPGIGTVYDLKSAWQVGAWVVRMATHYTEVDVPVRHIQYARELGVDTAGFLMMSHMITPKNLAKQAEPMGGYGTTCIYMMNSGDAMNMSNVRDRFRALKVELKPGT